MRRKGSCLPSLRAFMVRKATLDLEVSVSSIQAIRLFRELAEEAGWALERHEGSRLVDRFAIIMPMAQSARTLGLKVLSGPMQGMELTCWSETRGSSGAVNIASWLVPGGNDEPLFRDLLQHWVSRMDRCPWRWTFGERSKVGTSCPFGARLGADFPISVSTPKNRVGPSTPRPFGGRLIPSMRFKTPRKNRPYASPHRGRRTDALGASLYGRVLRKGHKVALC